MNTEWSEVTIGEIASIPQKHPESNPQEIELIRVRQNGKGAERTGKKPRITNNGRPYFRRCQGELLVARQSLQAGGAALVTQDCDALICSNIITSLTPSERVNGTYLLYCLLSEDIRREVALQSEGTAQSEISESKLLSLTLRIPPLREQIKIAEIITSAQRYISNIQLKIDKLKALNSIAEEDCFRGDKSDAHRPTEDRQPLDYMSLKDIAKFSQGVQVGVENHCPENNNGQVRFLRISDYTKKDERHRFIDQSFAKKGIVAKDDIVMIRYGEAGRVCRGKEGAIANNLFTITPNESLSKDYLFRYLNSARVQMQLRQISENTAMPAINFSRLGDLQVPILAGSTQMKVCEILAGFESAICSLENKVEKDILLLESLTKDLLSGRKRVSV